MNPVHSLRDRSIAIAGAGVSGLAAAHRLRKWGAKVTIFEKSDVVGGRTRSLRSDGFTIDLGALMMMPTYKNVIALAHELGIEKHLIATRPVISIVRERRHHELDMRRQIRSALSMKLISVPSAFKLLKLLPVIARHWSTFHYENMGELASLDDETVHDFCQRELNEEIETWIASPLIRAGSLTGTREAPIGDWLWQAVGFRYPTVLQWDQGMDFFAQSLAKGQLVRLGAMVTSVRDDDGRAVVQVREGAVLREETFDACLLAMPTTVSRCIAPSMSLPQSEFFDNLHGVPMISLHLGLRAQPASKASMILIPEQESADIMMILLDHNKVDGRTPPGKGICTIWSTKEWTRANTDSSDERVTIDLCRLAEPFVGKVRPLIEFSHIERRDFVVHRLILAFLLGCETTWQPVTLINRFSSPETSALRELKAQ